MRLIDAVSQGSGKWNEDTVGYVSDGTHVTAAWVIDGVTGINKTQYVSGHSDAQWFARLANRHLQTLAASNASLEHILRRLIQMLKQDFLAATANIAFPADYDPPAACLLLAKCDADGWKAIRLGDSYLLADGPPFRLEVPFDSDLNPLEETLKREARIKRQAGVSDFKQLLAESHEQHLASRRKRNTPGEYGVLVPGDEAVNCVEYFDLGQPRSLLLCTDGFYRAVDHYHLTNPTTLLSTCEKRGGISEMLGSIRQTEADDPACMKYLRFKPADDASAICLVEG